jgi:hypothetical protein
VAFDQLAWPGLLGQLALDGHPMVRTAVARHPSNDLDVQRTLIGNGLSQRYKTRLPDGHA